MSLKSPEDELAEFLSSLPSWHRKLLQLDFALTADELSAWQQSDWWQNGGQTDDRYLELLERCHKQWREYRARKRKRALEDVPPARPGRPKTSASDLVLVLTLEERGLNEEQIAKRLGLTREAVRKRLKVAKKQVKP